MTTANEILNVARKYLGIKEGGSGHKHILSVYNNCKPLPQGYKVSATDSWCATFVSFCAIEAGNANLFGRECSVPRFIPIFQAQGIWIEDGTVTPQPGDIIVYDWDTSVQPNNGNPDHIGFVESVSGGVITAIEGNKNDAVQRRSISVGAGNIRGFARPKYSGSGSTSGNTSSPSKSITEIAQEVLNGKYGNDPERSISLTKLGYKPAEVQAEVNRLAKGSNHVKPPVSQAVSGAIADIQRWLNSNYSTRLNVDNTNGQATKRALAKAIQTEINRQFGGGISIDGIFGNNSRAAFKTVREGAKGNITRIIQAALICKGYSVNGFDGTFGGGLKAAVIQFQKDHGLDADGVVGKDTAYRLFA